jgi:hypothetical protein
VFLKSDKKKLLHKIKHYIINTTKTEPHCEIPFLSYFSNSKKREGGLYMLPCPKGKIYLFFPIKFFITGCYEKLSAGAEKNK